MSVLLYGIGVCRGIAMGKAKLISPDMLEIPHLKLAEDDLAQQCLRYKAAVTIARQQLATVKEEIPSDAPKDIHEFIDSHLLMLQAAAFTTGPISIIYEEGCNAEWALQIQRDRLVSVFEQMEDEYLRTREDDINYLVSRIQNLLVHGPLKGSSVLAESSSKLPHVLITEELSPADLIILKAQGGSALVTEKGGPTSHTAILARGLNIPTIVGANNACCFCQDAEQVIVDGALGLIVADPDQNFNRYFYQKHAHSKQLNQAYQELKSTPTMTEDGQIITLRANMELPKDISAAQNVSAKGIGLFRTEYLFMDREEVPDETEQLHAYLDVIAAMAPDIVTIRSFDLGSDKQPRALKDRFKHDDNPALGLRAIRLCLAEPSLFRPQLRAILRASALGKVRLLLPMLSCPSEIDRALAVIDSVKQELNSQGFAYDSNIQIGSMIEVPSAALAASYFAKKLDFLSIGTNDLIQYTLAIDRNNEHVNYLHNTIHPSVLNLIQMTIDAGKQAHIPVSMCGEMAGDTKYTRVLLAMGLLEFSMHPNTLLEVKHAIHNTNLTEKLLQNVDMLKQCYSASESEQLLCTINQL